ncbi:MAG: LpqB family beta-propeller domain-containing protein [Pseudonocardiaceae bacterium]
MSSRRGTRWLAAVAAVAFAAGGCANVPSETQPQVVKDVSGPLQQEEIEEPRADLSPADIVREFVKANARSVDHQESRLYLDRASRVRWHPAKTIAILDEQFSTVLAPIDEQPEDENERIVMLTGRQVGTLGVDSAFIPGALPYEKRVTVRRQADGQWRIADPPAEVMITVSEFEANYFKVPVYFFAPDGDVRVPDPRYVLSRPQAGLPAKVMALLLEGPSSYLTGAVDNPLGDQVELDTNVTNDPDGALEVPLVGASGYSEQTKQRIAAQIVFSLESVTTSRVRITTDGVPLLADQPELRPSDLPSYSATSLLSAELPGMAVVGSRLLSLGDGEPVDGPAGNGVYDLVTAAQSLGGSQLALVERREKGVRLRVGPISGAAQVVELEGNRLTRPTWRPALSGNQVSNEVWTVQDGKKVVRVLLTPQGTWTPQEVNATEITPFGEITALRLSRDGTRAVVVADRKLIVAAVARSSDAVRLQSPRVLQPEVLDDVVDADWLSQDMIVVATGSALRPVVKVTVDGYRMDPFNSANLTPPISAITAASGRAVVAADIRGLWTASGVGEVWRPHPQVQGASVSPAEPFYPG